MDEGKVAAIGFYGDTDMENPSVPGEEDQVSGLDFFDGFDGLADRKLVL